MRRVPVQNRTQALIGAIGIARSDLTPAGIVRAGGEDWSAYVERGSVVKGAKVRVRRFDSIRLVVEPAEPEEEEAE
jgi:membrane protein implicated in regulation of membrane protease activity